MTTNLSTWDPVRDVVSLRDAMSRLFEESFVRPSRLTNGNRNGARTLTPTANVWQTDEAFGIEMAIPGADPSTVDVTYQNGRVVIDGQIAPLDDEREWVLVERPYGSFRRTMQLNVPVEVDHAAARYHNGLLTVELPKAETVKPRKIKVMAG